MFFSVSKIADQRFPFSEQLGDWIFNHDEGWHVDRGGSWHKGYCHSDINYGCWTKIAINNGVIDIGSAAQRGYPLWWNSENLSLSNLESQGQQIWADCKTTVSDNNIVCSKLDILGNLDDEKLSADRVVDLLCQNLRAKTNALFADTLPPKKIFPTGGLDSSTVLALVSDRLDQIELLDYEHFEYDFFTNKNIKCIRRNHWAYNQIHHWKSPCVLLTGASGDPAMMRHPLLASIWCAWHDIDLCDKLEHQTGYNKDNLLRNKDTVLKYWDQRSSLKTKFQTYPDLVNYLLDISINDFQHWHLGNTLTWTPFMDAELTKIILSLDPSDILAQIIDGYISKRLIQKLDSELLTLVSERKNDSDRHNLDSIHDLIMSRI